MDNFLNFFRFFEKTGKICRKRTEVLCCGVTIRDKGLKTSYHNNTESISANVQKSWPKQLLNRHYILNADRSACTDQSVSVSNRYSFGLSNDCKWYNHNS